MAFSKLMAIAGKALKDAKDEAKRLEARMPPETDRHGKPTGKLTKPQPQKYAGIIKDILNGSVHGNVLRDALEADLRAEIGAGEPAEAEA